MSKAIVTAKIEAATLITVLPSSIVTRSLLGLSRRLRIYFSIIPLEFFKSLKIFFSNEKSATSEPEKKAENKISTNKKIIRSNQSVSKNYFNPNC